MTDKDYLQIAKDDLDYSHGCRREYKDQILDAAQAQAAALIVIAEEWRKYNEREEMVLAKTRNFVVSP